MMNCYDKKYFEWQKTMGEFGGRENIFKFKDFITENDKVIEYGCGGGYFLKNIKCKEKIGIEINPYAIEEAQKNGLTVVDSINKIEDDWANVIISDNVLEHTLSPLDELKALHKKLKNNGKIVFVIPHELKKSYAPNDINQHLYTWTPQCAYNLFTLAGFKVKKIDRIRYLWPPGAYQIRKYLGKLIFDIMCKIYGRIFGDWYQIRIIATKK